MWTENENLLKAWKPYLDARKCAFRIEPSREHTLKMCRAAEYEIYHCAQFKSVFEECMKGIGGLKFAQLAERLPLIFAWKE